VKKKKLLIVNCLLLIGGCVVLSGCVPKNTSSPPPTGNQEVSTPTKPPSQTISEAPFVQLIPSADGHWVDLEVKNIKSGTKSVDYELIYFAGEEGNKIERGVAGTVDLKGENNLVRKILFGSESCTTGKCKYKFDENISEGMLTLKLKGDFGIEKYESSFRLQKGLEGKEGINAGDGIFNFVSDNLSKNAYYLTISTFGLPAKIEGNASVSPYGIFPSVAAKGTVSFKTANQSNKILFWDNGKWQELTSSFADGWLSASVSKTGIFLLVTPGVN